MNGPSTHAVMAGRAGRRHGTGCPSVCPHHNRIDYRRVARRREGRETARLAHAAIAERPSRRSAD